jgi:hypothetical protein
VVQLAHHLTKSKFLAGRQCPKRLWLSRHDPGRAAPLPAAARAIREVGEVIGRLAHGLFPGGILVEAGPREHAEAVRRTCDLLSDDAVPAIFEAAFEYSGVRIRVDVLERLTTGGWGLREVKAAARIKGSYLEDVSIQEFVLRGCGVRIDSVELIHPNPKFVRPEGNTDWGQFFTRVEIAEETAAFHCDLPGQIDELRGVINEAAPPDVEPSPHCRTRRPCEFWEHCTRDKDPDWILHMPRVTRKQFEALTAAGVDRITDIPGNFPLQPTQRHVREASVSGEEFVAHGLMGALDGAGPPAAYLDFETANPTVPLYPGTRPFQLLPFQWSLHRDAGDGVLMHQEFLADGAGEPSRAFAESLTLAMGGSDEPVLVYSPFESRVIGNLAAVFEDLRDPLLAIRARLVDLLPIVRDSVYHRDFNGSFSIKRVAPALAPGFGYDDLVGVSEGGGAAEAFRRIAAGGLALDEVARLRGELLAYCARDTQALFELHRALRARVAGGAA